MKADFFQKNEKIEQKFSRLLLACRGRCVSGRAGASVCTYLCVTVRGTMVLSQVYCALYSPHSPQTAASLPPLLPFLPLPIASIRVFCFLNVLIPHLEDKLRLSPQLLWQHLHVEKSEFEGANEMCNNMHGHSASLSKNRKCKLLRHVSHAGWWASHFHQFTKKCGQNLVCNLHFRHIKWTLYVILVLELQMV